MEKGANISPCKKYRYDLYRIWDKSKPTVLFICLNPSTADAENDDPTIRRCIGFAKDWGYGGFHMANLFAYRATEPADMKKAADPVGPYNDSYLTKLSKECKLIVCAWGNDGNFINRAAVVIQRILPHGSTYLKMNKTGEPAHPLYLKKDLKPQPYHF